MTDSRDLDDLDGQLEALETTIGGAVQMTAAFEGELRRMERAFDGAKSGASTLSGSISRGLRKAFDGLVFDGMKASDAMRTVASSMIESAYSAAIKPVTNHFGGILGQGIESFITGGFFEKGGAFSQGRVVPFAKGGVVTGPTMFPMQGATGLMGEAGPEAIMPLSRGPDGSLGVRAQAQGPVNVTMNISTPDVGGFQRSQAQVAAQVGRAIARGQRNR